MLKAAINEIGGARSSCDRRQRTFGQPSVGMEKQQDFPSGKRGTGVHLAGAATARADHLNGGVLREHAAAGVTTIAVDGDNLDIPVSGPLAIEMAQSRGQRNGLVNERNDDGDSQATRSSQGGRCARKSVAIVAAVNPKCANAGAPAAIISPASAR